MKNFVGVKTSGFKHIFEVAFIALFSALLFILNFTIAWIPNVELGTTLMMICAISFKKRVSFGIVNVYCLLNLIFYGTNDDNLMYFVVFNLYAAIMYLLKNFLINNKFYFILIVAIFGYSFGSWFALEKWCLYGKTFAISYWFNGLIFDLIHGTANSLISFVLYDKVLKLFSNIEQEYFFIFNKNFTKKYKPKYVI
ncbi:hypothetical protein [Spiroplasma endosymbiont of Amphibalanus improvisus]|uniref:hypothetical protein n=1 Tax=Spiroplasma endosymbiont of Amphibalanus improvisus TaxID=3066327 RepID=UPI00313DE68C